MDNMTMQKGAKEKAELQALIEAAVRAQDAALAHALGARGLDEVLPGHFQHRAARQPCVDRHVEQSQRQRGQHQEPCVDALPR